MKSPENNRGFLTFASCAALLTVLCGFGCSTFAESSIVQNGEARGRIVIARNPPRMVDLAAKELKLFVRKMTGAAIPIVNEPGDTASVTIFVGESEHTRRLGVTAEGLKHGAFRMVSGDTWLALVGDDYDFEPREPTPRSHGDTARAQQEWEQITGAVWLNPMLRTYKAYNREFGYWEMDQGGSLNAVYAFLRSLGVRWYMPGEPGEVVPHRASIALPEVDETVRPSFALRCLKWTSYAALEWDDLIWDRRMGLNRGYQVWGAKTFVSHGMRAVIGHERMQQAHPEYYAWIGNRRQTQRRGSGRPCLRSDGLINETVRYCRAVFDHYDEPMVDIWPTDGFAQCQCPLCRDITNVSDYVWRFVARVATEVLASHPDRRISCGAYNIYAAPPPGIDKLPPNVVVYVANRGRPAFDRPEKWREYRSTIEGWRDRVAPGNILRGENQNSSTSLGGRGGPVPYPILHPREYARDLQYLRGICMGERNETSRGVRRAGKEHTWRAPGLDHLNYYVNARFLWDAGQDIQRVLDEYYTLFYGPAAEEMRVAFEFADAEFPSRDGSMPSMDVRADFLEQLHAARAAAGDGIYGQRIRFILDELPSLERVRAAGRLAERRGNEVMTFDRLMHDEIYKELKDTFRADGKLNEEFWLNYTAGRSLRDAGREFKTTFWGRWVGNTLYFAIRCREDTTHPLNVSTTRDDDPALLEDDRVEFLIETGPKHCYRIAINPAGAVFDADMTAGGGGVKWFSHADAGAHVGDGFWSVEVKLPIQGADAASMDHLNYIAGGRPTSAWPWFFNVIRVRVRKGEKHVMAYSPLGCGNPDDRSTFARLLLRRDAKRLEARARSRSGRGE